METRVKYRFEDPEEEQLWEDARIWVYRNFGAAIPVDMAFEFSSLGWDPDDVNEILEREYLENGKEFDYGSVSLGVWDSRRAELQVQEREGRVHGAGTDGPRGRPESETVH